MSIPSSMAILALTACLVGAAEDLSSVVRFSNQDQLPGSIESLTTERLVWKSPTLEKPTGFFLKSVLEVTLTPVEPVNQARHEASITLTNGDLIRGQLVSASDDRIELDTWFAGRMKFNRLMVNDIRISENTELNYRGPTGLDGWILSGELSAWIYQNSSLHSKSAGSIARDVGLPDECHVAFTVAWRNSLGMKVVIFSKDLATERPTSGYEITFMQRRAFVRNCKTQRIVGTTHNAVALQENEKAQIELQASLKTGKITLAVDGEMIEVWTDPEVIRDGIGRGIHFVSQNDSPVQISRIAVGPWDGEVTQVPNRQEVNGFMPQNDELVVPPPVAARKKLAPGRMELRNGDEIQGELLTIEDGMVRLKTPFREVRLPVGALRSVALKPVDLERCKRENGDVRAWFPDGSSVVFRMDGVGEGTLLGSSQNFSPSEFKLAAFSRIEFNIYEPDYEDVRLATGN
jgi:hypothetical protein